MKLNEGERALLLGLKDGEWHDTAYMQGFRLRPLLDMAVGGMVEYRGGSENPLLLRITRLGASEISGFLTPFQRAVLSAVPCDAEWTAGDIRDVLGLPRAPSSVLRALRAKGLVTGIVGANTSLWRRTPAGTAALEGGDGR